VRDDDERPFFMLVSFSHPHDPYNIPRDYWDRYDHSAIDLPAVPPIPLGKRDPHSRRLYDNYDRGEFEITEEQVRNARHAYYGSVSYVDDRIGELLRALEATGQFEDTIIIVVSDHGDMLGERGMWFKMTFFEWACRVPLIFHAPWRFAPARRQQNVSLVDLLPTLLDITDSATDLAAPLDGHSLVPLIADAGAEWPDTVLGEYFAEGSVAPIYMVRQGQYKFVACAVDPPLFYDLEVDPAELENLAGKREHAEMERVLADMARATWDNEAITRDVVASQQQRRKVSQALMTGERTLWDYESPRDESHAYIRNIAGLYEKEERAFLPRRGTRKG
jgi:choline-sulfatase